MRTETIHLPVKHSIGPWCHLSKNLYNNLTVPKETKIPPDKKLHFIVSAVLSVVLVLIGVIVWNLIIAVGITMITAILGYTILSFFEKKKNIILFSELFSFLLSEIGWIGKEFWDDGRIFQWLIKKDPLTGFSWSDLGYDQIGIAIGITVTLIAFLVWFGNQEKET